MKIVNIDGEIFRKDVTYDNIETHKKPGLHPLFGRYICGKTTGRVKLTPPPPPAYLGLKLSLPKLLTKLSNEELKNWKLSIKATLLLMLKFMFFLIHLV